jgi:hypothetical protein
METVVLTDKSIIPDNDLVFSIIGENKIHWQKMTGFVHAKYPDALEQWNYYNDGKSWLFRMIRKKKTLFWVGVLKDTFRITFYFGDKAEPFIEKSDLPTGMKEGFKNGKRYGKIRAITMRVEKDEDIEHAIKLVEIRINS